MGKTVDYLKEKEKLRQMLAGQRITLVGGCFDILHFGHLTFLKKAHQDGEILAVALESDEFIKQKKQKEPIHTQLQRAEILSHLDLVDLIILLPFFTTDKDYYQLVSFVRPSSIVCLKGDPNRKYKAEQASMNNARLIEVDAVEGFSSSAIKNYAALSGN